ncbi:uncharacterized protein [Cicer arietinum]|uniref:Hybrid signal transduction histidine kinase A-like n=1 Tax=Cicer arietinum TaxID=3827 RepID=A0A1S2Z4C3_CICAR|nr:hybrid signal transduction histidine kinase A-like [Cicer arietinum]
MDSGNSGSISSSGDEEYDSRTNHQYHQTLLPSTFLNQQQQPTLQFGSIFSHNPQQSSLISSSFHHHHNPSLFDLSPNYLHSLSQSQPNINPFQNLNTTTSQGVLSSSSQQHINHTLLTPQILHDDDNNNNVRTTTTTSTTNVARNSKKRTRASRRAPTTVLTTDTSNFRSMVQEFTGIPAPPFSSSSYSRRLDLLTASSSLRSTSSSSSSSSHFDTSSSFYPLRPSPQKHDHHHHLNPLLLSSTSPPSSSTLLHNNNIHNYQLPCDLGLPNYNQHNFMLSMQNQPIHTFHPSSSSQQFHPPFNNIERFSSKSQQQAASLSVQSLEDLGVNQGQVNANLDDNDGDGSRRDVLRCLNESYGGKIVGSSSSSGGGGGKVNFSGSASTTLNHDKTLENNNNNNNNNNNRGEGDVGSWICSSD